MEEAGRFGGTRHRAGRRASIERRRERGFAAIFIPRLQEVTGLTHITCMIVHRRCAALVRGFRKGSGKTRCSIDRTIGARGKSRSRR